MSTIPYPCPDWPKCGCFYRGTFDPIRKQCDHREDETISDADVKEVILNGVLLEWLPEELLFRLDAYRGGQTRPQAIRKLLEEHLP